MSSETITAPEHYGRGDGSDEDSDEDLDKDSDEDPDEDPDEDLDEDDDTGENYTNTKRRKWDVSEILRLKISGGKRQATDLYRNTVQYATNFKAHDIARLNMAGLGYEARHLYACTVSFHQRKFDQYEIMDLLDAGLKDEANNLFDRFITFADDSQITKELQDRLQE